MPDFDVVIYGARIVGPTGISQQAIGIAGEHIVALGSKLIGTAAKEIDATNLHIFPGVIDSHVHFNEPGRSEWEGIATGSQALAAGGGTMFIDMPLNAHPPTIDATAFDLKLAAAEKNSVTDFALWGGLVPGNVESLEALAKRGVIGFKAFMSNSGIDDFASVDDHTLREGMKRAAGLKLPVAVHAESDALTQQLAAASISAGKTSIRDYLASRPIEAELDAIRRAIDLAAETGCALHIVHVSSAAGVALVTEAKRRNVNVTCETCPHYLVLTEEDVEKIGALAKCAPPLRSKSNQNLLWDRVRAGEVDTIGSDHSPAPPSMKTDANFFKVWGGISGVQHTLPLLLTELPRREIDLTEISRMVAANVARRFHLPPTKGHIAEHADADLTLVDLDASFEAQTEDLLYKHKHTPYTGRRLRGKVIRTLRRGTTIFHDGKIVAKDGGRLVKPLQ